jgi:hypothetical protein
MTKAQQFAESLTPAELSVLMRMESDVAIGPGAWSLVDYEIVDKSTRLYKSVFVSNEFGFGHMLTKFGQSVQAAANGDAPKE